MGIHFGGSGVGVPMGERVALEFLGEVAFELTAVIGEDSLDAIGEDCLDQSKELAGGEARVAARSPGEGEVRMKIGEGDDKTPAVIGLPFDGIERYTMSGMAGLEMLGFACSGYAFKLGLAVGTNSHRRMAHLVRGVGDEPSNGAYRRTAGVACVTKREQKRVNLLLGEIRMLRADTTDFGNHRGGPLTTAAALRRGRGGGQGSVGPPSRFPCKERAPAHFEGIHRRCQTVGLPELEYL